MRNYIVLLAFFSVANLSYAGQVITRTWDNGSTNGLWVDPMNWSSDLAPTISNNADVGFVSTGGPTIRDGDVANGYDIRVGASGGNLATLNVEAGGILNAGEYLMVGRDAVGYNGTVTTSGTINLGLTHPTNGHLWVGFNSQGTLNVNGGTINVAAAFGISEVAGVAGTVNLNGGTIYAGRFRINHTGGTAGKLNIGGTGRLIVDGDMDATIATYIATGLIASNGGVIMHDYNVTNAGKTTIFWVIEPSTICLLGFGALGLVVFKN